MDTPQTDVPVGREARLADLLRSARQTKGLDLGEVAARTNVRKEYLAALEEARYDDLPEDIYAKNFVRLYAQTVGVPPAKALELYSRERRGVASVPSTAPEVQGERLEPPPRLTAPRRVRPGLAVGAWLPTVLLIAAVVGLALWGFNNLLFRPARPAPPVVESPTAAGVTATAAADPTGEVAGSTATGSGVAGSGAASATAPDAQRRSSSATAPLPDDSKSLFTLTTDPPGADVTVDGFPLPGTTPITGLPLTPGVGRTLRVTLPGYETYAAPIDVSTDLRLSLTLTAVGATAGAESGTEAATGGATAGETTPTAPGQLTVRIDDTTWLEAYASTQRGVGERLVYTTVQPGATYTFDLPVYLHTGNAAGVLVTKEGQDLGAMGSSGEVVSRAYLP